MGNGFGEGAVDGLHCLRCLSKASVSQRKEPYAGLVTVHQKHTVINNDLGKSKISDIIIFKAVIAS